MMNTRKTSQPMVSVAVLSWNSQKETESCLRSIVEQDQGIPYELIVVENGSRDGSSEMIRKTFSSIKYPQIHGLFNKKNLGFAGGVNQAFHVAKGRYFLLLNSDTVIPERLLQHMSQFLDKHPAYTAVTTKLVNPDGSTQYLHRRFSKAYLIPLILFGKFSPFRSLSRLQTAYFYRDNNYETDFDIEQPAGANLMIRSDQFQGELLDENRFPIFFNDVDIARRIWDAGKRIRCLTDVAVIHDKGVSVKKMGFFLYTKEYVQSAILYYEKYGQTLQTLFLRGFFFVVFVGILIPTPLLFFLKKIDRTEMQQRLAHLSIPFYSMRDKTHTAIKKKNSLV